MKNLLLLLVPILVSNIALGQSAEKKISYVSENGSAVSDSSIAKSYRTLELNEKCYCYIVREYTLSGQIRSMEEYSQYDEKHTQDGKTIQFYENGNIKREGFYKNNIPEGEFIYYYENGKPRERVENIFDPKPRYLQAYDTQGHELLTDGNGVMTDTNDAGEVIYSKVEAYNIKSCYKIKSAQDTVFLPIEQQAEYPGGMQAMMRFLSLNVKYPRAARKARTEGAVYASFVVGKDGVLQDFLIVKGIHPECDAEVIRILKLMNPWNPGIQRGQAVKSRFVLPVKFHF
ncbi:energy transducer TonB [Parachryseolinea silvisoli]|uniref:energy transducer TonB n=1 Tax=Parachryseolinea silvisoli TaxID=2873601 RepID=UPI002265881F|nr:energy transducer TonB [Parachryseolinea silvisoli]MCD9018705.1 TonB family protein [Parachryseolinea silvisoli]